MSLQLLNELPKDARLLRGEGYVSRLRLRPSSVHSVIFELEAELLKSEQRSQRARRAAEVARQQGDAHASALVAENLEKYKDLETHAARVSKLLRAGDLRGASVLVKTSPNRRNLMSVVYWRYAKAVSPSGVLDISSLRYLEHSHGLFRVLVQLVAPDKCDACGQSGSLSISRVNQARTRYWFSCPCGHHTKSADRDRELEPDGGGYDKLTCQCAMCEDWRKNAFMRLSKTPWNVQFEDALATCLDEIHQACIAPDNRADTLSHSPQTSVAQSLPYGVHERPSVSSMPLPSWLPRPVPRITHYHRLPWETTHLVDRSPTLRMRMVRLERPGVSLLEQCLNDLESEVDPYARNAIRAGCTEVTQVGSWLRAVLGVLTTRRYLPLPVRLVVESGVAPAT